jgi:deazaflavin-dependent oxidoreductase (nitroreductase family)
MTAQTAAKPSIKVPHWLIRAIWFTHRRILAVTGGRLGLRPPTASRWGMLRLTTVGRRSGRTRVAILGYIEDGPNIVVPAMNGWMEPEPAWWLNLQSNPDATVELPSGESRAVTARATTGDDRNRLWRRLVDLGTAAYTDANAATRARETAIVILAPRQVAETQPAGASHAQSS